MAYTHARVHTHTHIHTCMDALTHIHTCTYIHSCAHMHVLVLYTCMPTCTLTHYTPPPQIKFDLKRKRKKGRRQEGSSCCWLCCLRKERGFHRNKGGDGAMGGNEATIREPTKHSVQTSVPLLINTPNRRGIRTAMQTSHS